jgi:hypothetical protein
MDEFALRVAYCAYSAILIALLSILLSKGLKRALLLRPVLLGFLVGMGCYLLLGAGTFGLMVSGLTTGYLFAGKVEGWSKHLRAGGLTGMLFMPNLSLVPVAYVLFKYNMAEIGEKLERAMSSGELLANVCWRTFLDAIFLIALVGLSAVLGGLLRKTLKPKDVTKNGSGVGQIGVPAGRGDNPRAKLIRC